MSPVACGSNPPLSSWVQYNGSVNGTNNNQMSQISQNMLHASGCDAVGDVLNDGINQYLYDAEGRICAVAAISLIGTTYTGYLYDAEGTRVAKGTITRWSCDPTLNGLQTTNDYILGPGGEQVTEMGINTTADSSATTLVWQHTNVWAGGKLLGTYDKAGLHFYFDDPLGTRRAQTDYAGVLEQTCSSLPYGDALTCSSQPETGGAPYLASLIAPTENHFTGKERDAESGNDYFEARYYSSAMGRFLSPDWAAKEAPVPYATFDDPQSLNLYSYVRNNPLSKTDPDGHCCWDQLVSSANQFANDHPVAVGIAKGLGNATLGVATVAVSLGGEAASGGLSTAISVVGVSAGTSLFVKGVTQAVGAATNTDVKRATKALDATRNPAGLVTTVATGGNMKAGDKAATALDVVTASSDVKELATKGMNGGLKIDAATGTKLTNLAQTAHDAQTALKPQQEQKKTDQK